MANYIARFMESGLVGYGLSGNWLVRKEVINAMLDSYKDKPVFINHKSDKKPVGKVENAFYNPTDGWYYANIKLDSSTAKGLVHEFDWSVSCAYSVLQYDYSKAPYMYNGIYYNYEVMQGEFLELSLTDSPRYGDANIKSLNNSIEEVLSMTKEEAQALINSSVAEAVAMALKEALPVLINSLKGEKEPVKQNGSAESQFKTVEMAKAEQRYNANLLNETEEAKAFVMANFNDNGDYKPLARLNTALEGKLGEERLATTLKHLLINSGLYYNLQGLEESIVDGMSLDVLRDRATLTKAKIAEIKANSAAAVANANRNKEQKDPLLLYFKQDKAFIKKINEQEAA
ncbi:MAG: hypothetical protein FWE37_02635 [Spirochaetaceae bacterium]|nr:hypothetical protein [Spirochaetaceae bacterium]